ncbi:uncharacterized protein B0H64DRAFT_343731 [Chaetomium fimeti]|uniref:Uncharacterized protein n=1 Tax=Chaetomium fimeti TaxID=1854472 RepID=A0AAE0HDH3_9PEZI|nr:hypothetical protein B0H64DRAFT_343731 [Chaetomium fimeti]
MSIFVNYDGPKLDKDQKRVVRSRAMVVVRGRRKQAECQVKSRRGTPKRLGRAPDEERGRTVSLAPARNDSSGNGGHLDSFEDDMQQALVAQEPATSSRSVANSSRKRDKTWMAVTRQRRPNLNPYDLRGAPPQSTHMTGVDARTFQDYLSRCGSYSSYLDEAFVLVGFQQPSYFRPDLSKAACIYIGWLLTAGVLDAVRGTQDITYPYYEYQAVRELQKFVDDADAKQLHEVVYPVVILGMFEMVRFSPRTITHLAAVEGFIKSRGGLHTMPDVMQHIVLMADTLQCICLSTPLAFSTLGTAPTPHLTTSPAFPAGNQLRSCPLLLCDGEALSLAAQYTDPSIRPGLVTALQDAHDAFRGFFGYPSSLPGPASPSTWSSSSTAVGEEADDGVPPVVPNSVPARLLETCALAARIMRNTLTDGLDGLDDPRNGLDVLVMYENVRFVGLKAWTGLPYVYVWVNLIGFAASRDMRMRSYFIAEVVRCAFSYGCYQMEVFQAVLWNFLHLRNVIEGGKMALAAFATGKVLGPL